MSDKLTGDEVRSMMYNERGVENPLTRGQNLTDFNIDTVSLGTTEEDMVITHGNFFRTYKWV